MSELPRVNLERARLRRVALRLKADIRQAEAVAQEEFSESMHADNELDLLREENAGLRAALELCPGCLRFDPKDPLGCGWLHDGWCAGRVERRTA